MLEKITDILVSRVQGKLDRIIPFAELKETGVGENAKTQPRHYLGNGQYGAINHDHFAGLGYFRLTDSVSIEEPFNDRKIPCAKVNNYSYPLRFVACIRKELIGKDDAFSSDFLIHTIDKDLQASNFKTHLNAQKVVYEPSTYHTDVNKILSDEYSGFPSIEKGIPLEYCLIAIDFKVIVTISPSCIDLTCNTLCYGSN